MRVGEKYITFFAILAILVGVVIEKVLLEFFYVKMRDTPIPEYACDDEHSYSECGTYDGADEVSRFSVFLVDGQLVG